MIIMRESLKNSVDDYLAFLDGETDRVETTTYTFKEAPDYSGQEIKAIRDKVGATRAVFADILDVSVRTVEKWEINGARPTGGTKRLLQLLDQNPTLIVNEIENASLAMG